MKKEWMNMLRNWRTAICIIICLCTLLSFHSSNDYLKQWKRIVYSTTDITHVRQWIVKYDPRQNELIPVAFVKPDIVIEKSKAYEKGFIMKLQSSTPIYAFADGFVLFTGHMPTTYKSMTIQFDNGVVATFGMLQNIRFLPYSVIQAGDIIAEPTNRYIYVAMEQNHRNLTLDEIMEFLSR